MKALLVVSAAPGRVAPAVSPRVLSYLPDGAEALRSATPDGVTVLAGPDPDDQVGAETFTVRLGRAVRNQRRDLGATELAALLGDGKDVDGAALAALLPPFAAAHRGSSGGPVVAATDWIGFRQLFWWQGDGVAAISTSALALGALAGATPDRAALGLQSLLGWQVGLGTVLTGVRKVPDGSLAVLAGGRIEIRRYVERSLRIDEPLSIPEVVAEMAQILRDFHDRYLDDHPDSVLQLTGGQDTRVLLSAVPKAKRAKLRALTVDVHGGSDSAFAARLSALCGLDHQIHWLDDTPPPTPAEAHALSLAASIGLDAMASPLALAPLLLAEAQLEQGHRLSGLGGETARGFYYFGQPHRGTTERRLIDQLSRWRLFANEAVHREVLEPDFAASSQVDALDLINAGFAGTSPEWLRATDEFYLFERMQRWAGAHGSVAAANRHFINPMFDRRFVALAHAVAPADKRGGRLTGELISALDAELAAYPLDSGLIPARLGTSGLGTRAAVARITARKAMGKVRQRLRRSGRPQLGATELAAAVLAHWRAEPDAVAMLRDTGLIRSAWLDGMLAGTRAAPPATVAFLVNMLVVTDVAGT